MSVIGAFQSGFVKVKATVGCKMRERSYKVFCCVIILLLLIVKDTQHENFCHDC